MTRMFNNFNVDEECIFKGAGRVVLAPLGTAFPGSIEDVMNVTTFALTSAWSDWGGTTCDGISFMRGFDADEGIEVCQLGTSILKGGARNWRGQVGFNLLETCLQDLDRAWEGSSDGAQVVDAQESYWDFGSPDEVTTYRVAVIQQHSRDDDNLRMFAVRRAALAGEDSELVMNNTDPAAVPVVLEMEADPTVDREDNMFRVFHYQG
jgi:hypothetical protein